MTTKSSKAELSLLQLILTHPMSEGDKMLCGELANRHPDGRFTKDRYDRKSGSDIVFSYSYTDPSGNRINMKVKPSVWSHQYRIEVKNYGIAGGSRFRYSSGYEAIRVMTFGGKRAYFESDAVNELVNEKLANIEESIMGFIECQMSERASRDEARRDLLKTRNAKADKLKAEVYSHFNVSAASTKFDALYDAVKKMGRKNLIVEAMEKLLPLMK